MPWSVLPAPAKPAALHHSPPPTLFPRCHSISVPLHPRGARVCTQRIAPKSQTGSRLQGLRGRHVGPDSTLAEEADFLTLQGSVWSRAAGRRPVDRESSRNGRNQWVAQTFGKGRVLGLEYVGSGRGLGKGVPQGGCGWRRSRLREGVSGVFWEEALWNHLLFLLLTNPAGNQDWLPSALLGSPPPQDLLLRAHRPHSVPGWEPLERGIGN